MRVRSAIGGNSMIRSFKDILADQAPDLLAQTKLPRKDPAYLTQRRAFDLHRERRLEALEMEAPDLFERLSLPRNHPQRLETPRALALWRGRKNRDLGRRHR
jgi:hypothetical protein